MDGLNGYEFGEKYSFEQLEEGIFLERFEVHREFEEDAVSPEDFIFGVLSPEDCVFLQETGDGATACQLSMIAQLLGEEAAQPWMEKAQAEGWYVPECGTSAEDMDALLRAAGLQTCRIDDCSMSDLLEILADGEKAMCSVSTVLLECPEAEGWPGISADRFMQVLGVDMRDAEFVQVHLYDPVRGGVRVCSLQDFIASWEAGGRQLVSAC